jgi:predicted adenine nucleotide alpha hydrolase (AANH) superfamily ATPase
MAGKRRILLHACCAVCFEAVVPALEEEGWAVTAYFYNPNIHPFREFQKRLRAIEVAAEARKVPLEADREYGLAFYLEKILAGDGDRCGRCYRARLDAAAEMAKREGFAAFTTTLLASNHQKHEVVRREGEAAGLRRGTEFVYHDWRDRMPSGVEAARKRSLYRQQYCGCIWSEYERFGPDGKRAGE